MNFSSRNKIINNFSLSTKKNLRILFVKTGYAAPHEPIEKAIIDSMKKVFSEVFVALRTDNLNEIAKAKNIDLVLVFSGTPLLNKQIQSLNKDGFKTAIWLVDDPYYTDIMKYVAPHYQFIFTQEINCVPYYRSLGCKNVYHLPLAADFHFFYPREVEDKYKTDIIFLGTAFTNRVKFIDSIADYLSTKNIFISGLNWDKLKSYHFLKDKIKLNQWMNPAETANYYNGTKIAINIHRSYDNVDFQAKNSQKIKAMSVNPRMFEIAACGTFQLTDIRQDLSHFYTPDIDLATYRTPNECIDKMEYYLKHENERREMSSRALLKTKQDHTFLNRILQLNQIVFGN